MTKKQFLYRLDMFDDDQEIVFKVFDFTGSIYDLRLFSVGGLLFGDEFAIDFQLMEIDDENGNRRFPFVDYK